MEYIIILDTDLFADRELFQRCFPNLSEGRQKKIAGYRLERDKRLSLGAGAALDLGLMRFGLREKDVKIFPGAHGKPGLEDGLPRFNLSHSGHYAVCALSDSQDVGVDIQAVRPVREALLRKACTAGEKALLEGLPPDRRDQQFCRLWTVKESYLKLLGAGLSLPADRLETGLGRPPLLRREGELQNVCFTQWELPGHWLTLCTREEAQPDTVTVTREDLLECCR